MPDQPTSIQLPDDLFQRLQQVATASHQCLEEVVVQTICGNLPPSLDDLSLDLRAAVADLSSLNDEALWKIAWEPLPPEHTRRQRHLLGMSQERTLSTKQQAELADLRAATDRSVTRRSYALALLKWRGHTVSVGL